MKDKDAFTRFANWTAGAAGRGALAKGLRDTDSPEVALAETATHTGR